MGVSLEKELLDGEVHAEYVFSDISDPEAVVVRSRVLDGPVTCVDDVPSWVIYALNEAKGHHEAVGLCPFAIHPDPFRGGPHVVVLCRIMDPAEVQALDWEDDLDEEEYYEDDEVDDDEYNMELVKGAVDTTDISDAEEEEEDSASEATVVHSTDGFYEPSEICAIENALNDGSVGDRSPTKLVLDPQAHMATNGDIPGGGGGYGERRSWPETPDEFSCADPAGDLNAEIQRRERMFWSWMERGSVEEQKFRYYKLLWDCAYLQQHVKTSQELERQENRKRVQMLEEFATLLGIPDHLIQRPMLWAIIHVVSSWIKDGKISASLPFELCIQGMDGQLVFASPQLAQVGNAYTSLPDGVMCTNVPRVDGSLARARISSATLQNEGYRFHVVQPLCAVA